jgi:transmembrane sensor
VNRGPERLGELGALLRAEQDAHIREAGYKEAARERFLTERSRRRPLPRALLLVAAIATMAALALPWALPKLGGGASFEVSGVPGRVGHWVSAKERPVALQFSDGSSVGVEPGARVRVTSVDEQGAEVVLESGHAEFAIVHRSQTRWSVAAGPFSVRVTGTRFRVEWSASEEEIRVDVQEGAVRVSGPLLDGERSVVAGQKLVASARRIELSQRPPNTVALEAPSAPHSADPRANAEPAVRPPPSAASSPKEIPPTWQLLARKGRYRDALAAVGSAHEAVLSSASSDDLLLFGDAARFGGQIGLGERAYLMVRNRFGGSNAAALAAFSLGRLSFDQRAAYGASAKWFSTYLSERPGGTFAAEAAGRLIEAHQRSGNASGARAAASRYLQRFPNGPHASLARTVLE